MNRASVFRQETSGLFLDHAISHPPVRVRFSEAPVLFVGPVISDEVPVRFQPGMSYNRYPTTTQRKAK